MLSALKSKIDSPANHMPTPIWRRTGIIRIGQPTQLRIFAQAAKFSIPSQFKRLLYFLTG